jgi:ketosteroid isomerase-like protein
MATPTKRVVVILCACGTLAVLAFIAVPRYGVWKATRAISAELAIQSRAFERKDIEGAVKPLTDDFVLVWDDGSSTGLRDEALSYAQMFSTSRSIKATFTIKKVTMLKGVAVVRQENKLTLVPANHGDRGRDIDDYCTTYWRQTRGKWREFRMTR